MTVADKSIPVVPDIGTEKAARLAAQRTGKPGRWVRLDCQHTRHVQQPVEAGQLLEWGSPDFSEGRLSGAGG